MSIKNAVVSDDDREFRKHKKTIADRQRDFVSLGSALGYINAKRLYRLDGYDSFEDFVEVYCEMSRSYAYRQIDAARVVAILSPTGDKSRAGDQVKNEAQARALVPLGLDRDAMLAVLATTQKRGRITASALVEVRVELYPHTRVIDGEVVPDRAEIEAPKSPLVEAMHQALEDAKAATDDLHRKLDETAAGESNTPADDGNESTHITRETPSAGDGLKAAPVPGNPQSADGGDMSPADGAELPEMLSAAPASGPSATSSVDGPDVTPKDGIDEDVRLGHGACEACGEAIDPDQVAQGYARCGDCDPDGDHLRPELDEGGRGQCAMCAAADLETAATVGEPAGFTARQREDAARQLGYLERGVLNVVGSVKHFMDVECPIAEAADETPRWAAELGKTTCLDCLRAVVASESVAEGSSGGPTPGLGNIDLVDARWRANIRKEAGKRLAQGLGVDQGLHFFPHKKVPQTCGEGAEGTWVYSIGETTCVRCLEAIAHHQDSPVEDQSASQARVLPSTGVDSPAAEHNDPGALVAEQPGPLVHIESRYAPKGAPECFGTGGDRPQERLSELTCPACLLWLAGDGADFAARWLAVGRLVPDDSSGAPSVASEAPAGGDDRPWDSSLTEAGPEAVATHDRPGTGHPDPHLGEAPVAPPAPDAGVTPRSDGGEDVGRDEVEGEPGPSSSTDPASTLMGPAYALLSALDELDYDVVSPMLLDREWSALDSLAVALPAAVELLQRWRSK